MSVSFTIVAPSSASAWNMAELPPVLIFGITVVGLCGMGASEAHQEGPSPHDYSFDVRGWVIFIICSKREGCRERPDQHSSDPAAMLWLCAATSGKGYLHPHIWTRRSGKRPVKAPGRDGPASQVQGTDGQTLSSVGQLVYRASLGTIPESQGI